MAEDRANKEDSLAEELPLFYEWLNLDDVDEQDVTTIARLETELFGLGAWSEAAVQQELQASSRYYAVARDKKSVIGYAGIWFDGEDAQIMTIGVASSYQGRHVGTALMGILTEKARSLGARRMLLEVATDNEPALAVYKSAGFEQIGLRKRYYQPENKDAYVMACVLRAGESVRGNPVGFSIPE
ncbi:ribosomal protein S18-alanine N-acetyltransferase [Alloscardovia macacae]|uniref:Ribosomal-protein-alanine N-acetyltransferase RimI n=1 Tax=Alloscardovia macacae TaxID=1160091 RepID=A0A261F585_9BIFI|nr:ribosomal protein S18-alanine N-acetyltransferase [Alloscardovia macacae]OZG54203.1 ribosomal-protein-alanine N-acetyltransferase RimI [Alloscardovia macacae]